MTTFEGWYRAGSFSFSVRADRPDLALLVDGFLTGFKVGQGSKGDQVDRQYALCARDARASTVSLSLGEGHLLTDQPLARAVDLILWEVSQAGIDSASPCVALHAAAVSLDGRAVLLPAAPGSGKTTLAAALTMAGCAYLSDELAPIDPVSAQVLPFPRPLWMMRDAIRLFPGLAEVLSDQPDDRASPKRHIRPYDLRPAPFGGSCPVGVVVFPTYAAGSPVLLQPLGRAQAVARLIENSFNFLRLGGAGLGALARMIAGASCYQMRSGDLPSAVATLMALLEKEGVSQPPGRSAHREPRPCSTTAGAAVPG
jgi:hypothetical protein